MQEHTNAKPPLEVNNPFTALTEVFYKPKAVFDALAVKENWSWLPFFILTFVLFMPPYLYFTVVDFDWWREAFTQALMGDVSPSEKANFMNSLTPRITQLSEAIANAFVYPILGFALLALYYNVLTRNDEKSVQGFSDWYGAMWWMAMPSLLAALLSIIILTFHNANAQIIDAVRHPLSLSYLFNLGFESPYSALLSAFRIDLLWTVFLGFVCLRSWTAFSIFKASITALAPFIALILFHLVSVLFAS